MADEEQFRGTERSGTGSCCGSFGELLRGFLPGAKEFLVTCRIKNASRVTVTLSPCRYSEKKEAEYADSYRRYPKSYKVVRNICADLGIHSDCYLEVDSDIPPGKGLSSSTADMVASVQALALALAVVLKPEYIARMLTEIEPNDGLHYGGTAAYHPTTGKLISQHDYVPPLRILGIDLGWSTGASASRQQPHPCSESEMDRYLELFREMDKALANRELERVCRIATESARLWQRIRPKPGLDDVLALVGETGALGAANAHNGAYLGLLYGEDRSDLDAVARTVRGRFPKNEVRWFETVAVGRPAKGGANG